MRPARLIEGNHPSLLVQLNIPSTVVALPASSSVVSVGSDISATPAATGTATATRMQWSIGNARNQFNNVENNGDLVTVEFAFRISNAAGVASGTTIDVVPRIAWTSAAGAQSELATAIRLTVVEPQLQTSVTITPTSVPLNSQTQICRTGALLLLLLVCRSLTR